MLVSAIWCDCLDRYGSVVRFHERPHDAANSIATIVSTRVLAPRYAVAWAAFFNFVAFLVFGLHVADTIGTRHHQPPMSSPTRSSSVR